MKIMRLALFDLDNTLLAGDSDFEWARFLIRQGVVDEARHAARSRRFFRAYQEGTLNISAFLDFQLKPLTQQPRSTLTQWHKIFLESFIRPLIGSKARTLVSGHLSKGDLCALVTATNSFVTGPIAREFGIHHLIATIPACENGEFTGKARGAPAFQEGKINRVSDWLESQGLWWSDFSDTFFYSDSHNDLPLLEKVTRPVAVNPDQSLRELAKQRGWKIISLY